MKILSAVAVGFVARPCRLEDDKDTLTLLIFIHNSKHIYKKKTIWVQKVSTLFFGRKKKTKKMHFFDGYMFSTGFSKEKEKKTKNSMKINRPSHCGAHFQSPHTNRFEFFFFKKQRGLIFF